MPRRATWIACLVEILFASAMQAQSQFSIRAASAQTVKGWQRMQVEHSYRAVWVSPTPAVTAGDIEKAQPETAPDGRTRIAVVFTDAGARKMRDLTIVQLKKLIALVVDGRLIWAPVVQQVQEGKEGVLTGNGSRRLTQEEVERVIAALP
jgi:preprotein translocase subunit SecD